MKALLTLLVVAAIGVMALTVENWFVCFRNRRAETVLISGVALCVFTLLLILIVHFGRLT